MDVTVPERRAGAVGAVRSSSIGARCSASEITIKDAIPVTSPARTLLDLADVFPDVALERALDEAAYLRLDLRGLRPRRGRRGSARLAQVLARHTPRHHPHPQASSRNACSPSAARFRIPTPDVNATAEGHTVDFLWRTQRLIVETDGWAAHGTRSAFERDRRRDADLIAAGWRVLRISYMRLDAHRPGSPRGSRRGPARLGAGSSSSLPLVRRPCMSSWARRTSESG